MRAARRTEITLETTETFTLPRDAASLSAPCPECGSLSGLVTPGRAVAFLGADLRAVCRAIDAGQVHTLTTAAGSLFLCLDSLEKSAPQPLPHSFKSSNFKSSIQPKPRRLK